MFLLLTMVLPATIKSSLDLIYTDKEPNFTKIVWLFISQRNIKLLFNVTLTKAEVASYMFLSFTVYSRQNER